MVAMADDQKLTPICGAHVGITFILGDTQWWEEGSKGPCNDL